MTASPSATPPGATATASPSRTPAPATATASPSATAQPPTASPTSQPTAVPCGPEFNFDGGTVQGLSSSSPSVLSLAATTAMPYQGSHSLQLGLALTATDNEALLSVSGSGFPKDLSGQSLAYWIYVPAGMSDLSNPSGATLYVKTGAGWVWSESAWMNLPPTAGWVQVTLDMSGVPNADVVQEMGIKVALGGTSPDWSGTVFVDSFGSAAPCYSPTPSPTASPVLPTATATPSATPVPGTATSTATPSATPLPGTPTSTGTSSATPLPGTPTSTATATPMAPTFTPSPSAAATVGCGPAFTFDDGTAQGLGGASPAVISVASTTAMPYQGSHSLQLGLALTATDNEALVSVSSPGFPKDYSGQTLAYWVYVPAGMSDASKPSGATLYVKTGAGWVWAESAWMNLPATAGWVKVSLDMSGVANAGDVKEMGIKIALGGTSPDWSGTVYVDSFGSDAVCGTPTSTLTATPTSALASPTPSATRSASPPAGSPTNSPSATPSRTPSPAQSPTATPSASPTQGVPGASPTASPTADLSEYGSIVAVRPYPNPQLGQGPLRFKVLLSGRVDTMELKLYTRAFICSSVLSQDGPWGKGWCTVQFDAPQLASGTYFFMMGGTGHNGHQGIPKKGIVVLLP